MYFDNHVYHVYNRGAHSQNIFQSDFQFEYCLNLMDKYRTKYGVLILAYCFMPNHFHLMLQQSEGGKISQFLQTTFNAYVQAFNKMEQHSGTIFQGAAKRIDVETDEYAVQLAQYIHYNPVAAGLVKRAEQWKYSDIHEWLGKRGFRFDGQLLRDLYFNGSSDYAESIKAYQMDREQKKIAKFLLD